MGGIRINDKKEEIIRYNYVPEKNNLRVKKMEYYEST